MEADAGPSSKGAADKHKSPKRNTGGGSKGSKNKATHSDAPDDSNELNYSFAPVVQVKHGREAIHYSLEVRQQPLQSRMVGSGEKSDRRPIDPPPVVRLRINDSSRATTDPTLLQSPYFFCYASLCSEDLASGEELYLLPNTKKPYLVGGVVSSLFHLRDPDTNGFSAFFIFPDIGVRVEGVFRLKLSMYEIVGGRVHHCTSVATDRFFVYSAKRFPGMGQATLMSRALADQGIRIRVRSKLPPKNAKRRRAASPIPAQAWRSVQDDSHHNAAREFPDALERFQPSTKLSRTDSQASYTGSMRADEFNVREPPATHQYSLSPRFAPHPQALYSHRGSGSLSPALPSALALPAQSLYGHPRGGPGPSLPSLSSMLGGALPPMPAAGGPGQYSYGAVPSYPPPLQSHPGYPVEYRGPLGSGQFTREGPPNRHSSSSPYQSSLTLENGGGASSMHYATPPQAGPGPPSSSYAQDRMEPVPRRSPWLTARYGERDVVGDVRLDRRNSGGGGGNHHQHLIGAERPTTSNESSLIQPWVGPLPPIWRERPRSPPLDHSLARHRD